MKIHYLFNYSPVLWIQIHLFWIRIQGYVLNFETKKLQLVSEKNNFLYEIKLFFDYNKIMVPEEIFS